MTVISSKLPPLKAATSRLKEETSMPRVSKTTLGLIGLALGVGVGLYFLRNDLPTRRQLGSRERLERAALDFVSQRARDARRFEFPSFRSAARDAEGSIPRLIDRWRD